jgi:hypothetical protein
MQFTNAHAFGYSFDTHNHADRTPRTHQIDVSFNGGMVRVFRHHFTLEDAIGSHTCSLEALAGVRPMAFLSGVQFLTSSHCKLRQTTEGQKWKVLKSEEFKATSVHQHAESAYVLQDRDNVKANLGFTGILCSVWNMIFHWTMYASGE